MNLVILDNKLVDGHIPISRLPETPERTMIIRESLMSNEEIKSKSNWITPEPLTYKQLLQLAELVHYNDYLEHLTEKLDSAESAKLPLVVSGDSDAQVSENSRSALCATLAMICHAVELTSFGFCKRAFCNVRPPGHHCCQYKAMGFCMLNNVAIATKYATKLMEPGSKFAIIDIDCHHGNGTQDIFYDDQNVLYISIHHHFMNNYPGTGKPDEKGNHNNVLNINLKSGSGHSKAVEAFEEKVIPKLNEFVPDLIFISCGFDAHYLDPVGTLKFTNETYTYMTKEIVKFADEHCKGRVISVLEGGYSETALKEASVAHVMELL